MGTLGGFIVLAAFIALGLWTAFTDGIDKLMRALRDRRWKRQLIKQGLISSSSEFKELVFYLSLYRFNEYSASAQVEEFSKHGVPLRKLVREDDERARNWIRTVMGDHHCSNHEKHKLEFLNFSIGDLVRHTEFGLGVILSISDENTEAVVDFRAAGKQYVKLSVSNKI